MHKHQPHTWTSRKYGGITTKPNKTRQKHRISNIGVALRSPTTPPSQLKTNAPRVSQMPNFAASFFTFWYLIHIMVIFHIGLKLNIINCIHIHVIFTYIRWIFSDIIKYTTRCGTTWPTLSYHNSRTYNVQPAEKLVITIVRLLEVPASIISFPNIPRTWLASRHR